jgi:hypothetical protein
MTKTEFVQARISISIISQDSRVDESDLHRRHVVY